ncbi:hypothetical protein ATI61_101183 [Archangium gephyra]|uniref:Phage protein n=1 Tax=Archangium gephyra TaxID=48 RepID=A0AAC8TGE2_9BACT|nr:hypothetical protein [Archangium gephyra]AKJ04740.1 Phage protein [Archangium gephyra]REG37205.1 hypothetical protein ATI61_101183 [Archangium gephyra]
MSNSDLKASSPSQQVGTRDGSDYHGYLGRLQAGFEEHVAHQQLFTTNAAGLWEAYLASFPEELRQQQNCNSCRQFIERFGHLVTLDETGHQGSPFWLEHLASEENLAAVQRLRGMVEKAHVNGVFLSSEPVWGNPETGVWKHLAVRVPQARVFKPGLLSASQKMAEHRENHRCLNVALDEFKAELLEQARVVLQAEALTRSEKFIGVVEWLIARQRERKTPQGRNLIWKAVASAPAGFCTPRSSMVGTLLEDLAAGLPFETVKKRFDDKMHPLQYQRPQAAPSAGNIQQAEEAIAKLGLAPALERRFATLADVPLTWKPRTDKPEKGGSVFGHLKSKEEARATDLKLPTKTLTWIKFRDTVLPTAEKMELLVPSSSSAFSALITAVHPDAPPLIQWDSPEQRNAVTWYFYQNPSTASSWGLTPGYVEVLGLTMKPNTWFGDRFPQQGQGVFFILKGSRDSRNSSLSLFPEHLRSDLHGIRATIEAFSRSRQLVVPEGEPLASGLMVIPSADSSWNVGLRVTSKGSVATYTLDRWD